MPLIELDGSGNGFCEGMPRAKSLMIRNRDAHDIRVALGYPAVTDTTTDEATGLTVLSGTTLVIEDRNGSAASQVALRGVAGDTVEVVRIP